MYKGVLPILFAFIVLSCNKPAAENGSAPASDSTADVTDTVGDGNTDGDYFFSETDSLEEEIENPEMIDVHQPGIDVCGFSSDGKYFAFTQFLEGDGPDGSAQVFVIDVAKNEWATKPASIEKLNEDLETELIKLRDQLLPKYNITYGKNKGQAYDLAGDKDVNIQGKKFTVDLKVNDLLIDLHVKGDGKDITLQKDSKLPKSRGSVREYRLSKAYVLGDKIAVFVEYDGEISVGFENYRYYDRKNIAVTGVIK